jgi:energy-coupling factor transporter ATP-binding protein EcfA2
MYSKKLLLLGGPSGSGKSTLASALETRYGTITHSLILPLYRALEDLLLPPDDISILPWDQQDFKASKIPHSNKTYRELLIAGGRFARQYLGEDFFSRRAHQEISTLFAADLADVVVIPNIRFINELEYFDRNPIPDCEQTIILLTRENTSWENDIGDIHFYTPDEFPYLPIQIENNSAIDDLVTKVALYI